MRPSCIVCWSKAAGFGFLAAGTGAGQTRVAGVQLLAEQFRKHPGRAAEADARQAFFGVCWSADGDGGPAEWRLSWSISPVFQGYETYSRKRLTWEGGGVKQ